MHVQWIVPHIDVVVCARLRRYPVPWHWYSHAHQVGSRVIADESLGIPKFPIESQDTQSAEGAVKDPDEKTWPDEDVPFTIREDFDMIVHRPKRCDRQHNVRDEEEFVVGSADTIE